jgi:hypothetical protein
MCPRFRCQEEEGLGTVLIDSTFRPLIDWIPGDPVNLLIGAAAGVAALAYIVFAADHGRGRTRKFEAPGPSPVAAIHYEYRNLSKGRKLLPALVALAFWWLGMWDTQRGVFDLGKLAFIGLPALVLLLPVQRRRLRVRPAVALYAHGILLDSWRGETLVPWQDVAHVETDPAVSTGYQPNTHLRLMIGRKDGREWRYSERDFGDEATTEFGMIVERAQRYVR